MSAQKKLWKSPLFVIALILAIPILLIASRSTYLLQVFRFTTQANEPSIPYGSYVITSTLRKPARYNFIAFRNDSQSGSAIWVFRLCGIPGDSVEIINGDLFVNHRPADSMLTLSHSYIVPAKDTAGLNIAAGAAIAADSGEVLIPYPDRNISKLRIPFRRYSMPIEVADAAIQKTYGQPWNIDNFGPVEVPSDSYFVLGDNRSNAVDSRYTGFIKKSQFAGTALNY